MRPIHALVLPCSLALLAGCDQPPDAGPADDLTEEVSAAATAEQFFDTSPETQDATGITSYGIKAGLIQGFITGPEATYTFSLGTPGSSTPHTTTGKITYKVAGQSVTVNLTGKRPGQSTTTITGTANGKSFSFRCDGPSGSLVGTPWSLPGSVQFETGFLFEDVFHDWEHNKLKGLPLGSANDIKCRIAGCLDFAGDVTNNPGLSIVGELGVFTYCRQ